MTHHQSAIARGRGHSLRTPETNDVLIGRIRTRINVEIMRETSICIVTETEGSDVPDKRHHYGIGGEASVNVAIGGETSLNVAIGGETSATVAAVGNNFEQAAVSADRRSQRIMQPGRSLGQRRLVICMKIVGQ